MDKTYYSDKNHITLFAGLCAAYGLRRVVISPGSRSAPLTVAFHHHPEITCWVIPDERSAAYFAIGIAQYTQEPVGMICTSGTAALNYAPAMAEAYHQQLPLIAITADRPPEWVGQLDGQTINQTGIYRNFVSFEAQLPVEINSKNEIWYLERLVRDGFFKLYTQKRPIHFNVPLREPLYHKADQHTRLIHPDVSRINISHNARLYNEQFSHEIEKYNRILIILGMRRLNPELSALMSLLADTQKVVILRETLSNITTTNTFLIADALLVSIHDQKVQKLTPDLVISFGEMLLSKPLKHWIRSLDTAEHWIIHEDEVTPDIFQRIGKIFSQHPENFLRFLSEHLSHITTQYYEEWENAYLRFSGIQSGFVENIPWSDMMVFNILSENIPGNSYIHLGNSSPVRYAQFFHWKNNIRFYGNRGTAGIDGCTSTAIGMASQTDNMVTLITGDVSFLYDTNALWNNYKKANFKIIVINNKGGNIFSLIPGPDQTGLIDTYFRTHMPVSLGYLCKAYGISYYQATNRQELKTTLDLFYTNQQCALLEIHTDLSVNTNIWKDYFKTIKNNMTYE